MSLDLSSRTSDHKEKAVARARLTLPLGILILAVQFNTAEGGTLV